MQDTDLNIELIGAYIQGTVNVEQSLFVDKMLATNEAWRDVYEGLLIAKEKDIDINTRINALSIEVLEDKTIEKLNPETKVVHLTPWKRYATMAAAIVGIFVVGYGALKLAQPFAPNNNGYAMQTSKEFNENDAIQIIEPSNRPFIQNKTFKESDLSASNVILDDTENATDEETVTKLKPLQSEALEETFQLATKTLIQPEQIQLVQLKTNENVSSYANLLAYYGYKEIHFNERPTLLNTVRGANNRDEQLIARVQKHAYSNLNEYFAQQEQNYIARFPFSGLVKIELTIDENKEISTYKVIDSPNEEMTKVVVDMLQKTPWSAPINERGRPTAEKFITTISFGNTIFIKIDKE